MSQGKETRNYMRKITARIPVFWILKLILVKKLLKGEKRWTQRKEGEAAAW